MNSEMPCYSFLLLWCLNNVSLFVWSKEEKQLGSICWSSSQHLFWFCFFSPLSVLTLVKTSPGYFSSPPFCSPAPCSFSGFCCFTHRPISAEPRWISPVELFAQGWAQCSTFLVMFVLAHDGNNRRITLICTISDSCFCVMSLTHLLLN